MKDESIQPTGPVFILHPSSFILLFLIVLAGSALRIAGIFGDMWLDEVWSYDLTSKVHRVSDLLLATELRMDNNHPINTLYLWLVGFQKQWWIYRVPSIIFGLAGLVYFPFIALRYGRRDAIFATALFSFSHPLTFFCSEARGYAMVLFFSLLAFDAAVRYTARPSWGSAVAFWVGCVLGLLSHLTFIFFYGGLIVWTVYRLCKADWWKIFSSDVLRLHVIPAGFTAFLYLIFGRFVIIGGGPPVPRHHEIASAAASLVAIRGAFPVEAVVTLAVAALCIWVIVRLAMNRSDLWILLLVSLIVTPAAVFVHQWLFLPTIQPIQPRYFLVLLPFLIIAISTLLPDLFRRPSTRPVAIVALVIFFTANLWHTINWLRIGRAHHSDAVLYMANNTPGQRVTVIYNHLLRTGSLLDFYGRRIMPPGKEMITFDGEQPIPDDIGPPLWAVHTSYLATPTPPDPRTGVRYVFEREFTHFGLSGYSWYVYRRQ